MTSNVGTRLITIIIIMTTSVVMNVFHRKSFKFDEKMDSLFCLVSI